jgi:hypothetical protein
MKLIDLAPQIIAEVVPFMEGMKDVLINAGVDRQSELIASFEITDEVGTNVLTIEIIANDYIFFVDQGRGPTESFAGDGQVKKKIKDWIDRRNITDTKSTGRKLTTDELAFLISRKIHREGYKGKLVLLPYIDSREPELFNAMDKIILQTDVFNT